TFFNVSHRRRHEAHTRVDADRHASRFPDGAWTRAAAAPGPEPGRVALRSLHRSAGDARYFLPGLDDWAGIRGTRHGGSAARLSASRENHGFSRQSKPCAVSDVGSARHAATAAADEPGELSGSH